MIQFIKNNSHLIRRLILNQIGMTIFGLMTSMAAAAVDSSLADGNGELRRTCMIWVSVFSIIFYMYINYMALKEEGQKDKLRVDAGRTERTPLRGFYIALTASAVNILLGIFVIVFGALGAESGLALEWAGNISGTSKLIAAVIEAMYWGLMLGGSGAATIADVPSFVFILLPIPTLICGFISYYFGLIDVSLMRSIKSFFTPENK